jgi:type IV secretion system protein VirB1
LVIDIIALSQQCAPDVHYDTMQRIVHVESSFNPYAIGVVGAHLERQPRTRDEAIATAQWLQQNGFNFSVGLAQVNKTNFAKYGLTLETAFESCLNLGAGAEIIKDCYGRAKKKYGDEQVALRAAFSCYYSGNFTTGFDQGYVLKIVGAGSVVPALNLDEVNTQKQLKPAAVLPITRSRKTSSYSAVKGAEHQNISGKAIPTSARSDPAAGFSDTPQSSSSALLF